MNITATAVKDGKWWVVDFEAEGRTFHTQSRTLVGVEPMVRDALDLLEIPAESITISTPYTSRASEILREATEIEKRAERVKAERLALVSSMRENGLSLQDIALILGVSYQRVAQLVA